MRCEEVEEGVAVSEAETANMEGPQATDKILQEKDIE